MANTFDGSIVEQVNERRFATDFWTEALYSNDVAPFVSSVGMVVAGMKENSFKLPKLSGTVSIADGAACSDDFDNGNDTTISQSEITLTKFLIQDSFCPHSEAYETFFTAFGMPAGQHYTSLGIWQAPLVAEIGRRVGKRLALNMWLGNQAGDTWSYDGFHDQLLAANLGTYNAGSNPTGGNVGTTTPTSGGASGTDAEGVYNICEALVVAALTSTSVAGSDLAADLIAGNCYIVMSPLNREFMRQNYQKRYGLAMQEHAPGLAGLVANTQGAFNFPGYNVPVLTQAHIPNSTIILSRKGNQVLAFDLESDLTRLDIWLADDHDTIRWKYRGKMGNGFRALDGSNLKVWGPAS